MAAEAPATASFSTDAVVPEVGDNPTATETKAILAGWVNPHNSATEYHFEWGPTARPIRASTPVEDAGSGNQPVYATATVKGLGQTRPTTTGLSRPAPRAARRRVATAPS